MLKKIIPFALALSMLIPTIASAQALPTQTKSARAPYASQLNSERATIKANYATNQAIRVIIKGKLVQVKALIAQDKANKTLNPDYS